MDYTNVTPFSRGINKRLLGVDTSLNTPFYFETNSIVPYFNVKAYGAIGNSIANDTIAIQNTINAVHEAGGGVCYIPSGTYLSAALTYYEEVHIMGEGWYKSILKSITAEPMLSCIVLGYTATTGRSVGRLSNFCIDGNHVGTIGLNIQNISNFLFEHIYIKGTIQYGIYSLGSLMGTMRQVWMAQESDYSYYALIGAYFGNSQQPASNYYCQANLMQFDRCDFQGSQWGLVYDHSASLMLNTCNFSYCGTTGDYNTGGLRVTNACQNNEGIGISLYNCWSENGRGTTLKFEEPLGITKHAIRDMVFYNGQRDLHVIGASHINEVLIENSNLSTAYADGATAKIKGINSIITTPTLTNGATLTNAVFS